jgi:transcriptional regulator with XRE-family HTH domain
VALLSVHHPRYLALQAELARLRKKAGWSQVQLAERLGVGQSFVSKIERGEAYVDALFFIDWCRACNARPGAVLDRLAGRADG